VVLALSRSSQRCAMAQRCSMAGMKPATSFSVKGRAASSSRDAVLNLGEDGKGRWDGSEPGAQ
jgi:hypothetical protein